VTKVPARKMEFFSAKNLDDLPPEARGPNNATIEVSFMDEAQKEVFFEMSALYGPHIKSSAFEFEDTGMHVGVFEFGPGLVLPLHSHPDDCIYYVERGSVIMGNREIGPGEGFLTRKGQPYAFVVGPNGLRLVEFTTGPRTGLTVHERFIENWKVRAENAVASLSGC
jgi:hypothetical protein